MSAISKDLKTINLDIHSNSIIQRWGSSRLHAIPAVGKQVAGTVLSIFATAVCGVSTIAKLPFQAVHLVWKTNPTLNKIIDKMPGVDKFIGFAIFSVLSALGAMSSLLLGVIVYPAWNITVQNKLGFISDKKLAKFAQFVKDAEKKQHEKVKKPEKKEGEKANEAEGKTKEKLVIEVKKEIKEKKKAGSSKAGKAEKGHHKEKEKIQKLTIDDGEELDIRGEDEKIG